MATAAGRSAGDTQLFIWGVFEKFTVDGTLPFFLNLLKWSFQICFEGKWPKKDWRGLATLD